MINENRIVPVTKSDLLSIYANMCIISGKDVTVVHASNIGVFSITDDLTIDDYVVCAEPVKSVELNDNTAGNVLFIPAVDFDGFYADGVKITFDGGAEVEADGATLYMAHLSSGEPMLYKYY